MEEKPINIKKAEREDRYTAKAYDRKHSSCHIAGFVLGIISMLSTFFWYIAIPSGILAIVFGVKSSRATASKLGKAGLILGIIGLAACLFVYISMLFLTFLSYV